MKSVIITTFILIGITIMIFSSSAYTDAGVDELSTSLDLVSEAASEGNWEKAMVHFEELSENWTKRSAVFAVMHHHRNLDEIDKSIPQIKVFIQIKDLKNFLSESAVLKSELENLKYSDKISVRNLF